MGLIQFIIVCLAPLLTITAAAEPLPDILFQSNSGFGGYGRLNYSEPDQRYHLVDGRINSYVVDGQSIRLMRPEERGGSMANPSRLVVVDGKIIMATAYGQLNQLDPVTGEIGNTYAYSKFRFGGSGSAPVLYGWGAHLLSMHDSVLVTFDSSLRKLGETHLDEKVRHVRLSPNFHQDRSQLFALEFDNPNTYTDCVDGCNLPSVLRQTSIDFTQPSSIQVKTTEAKVDRQINFSVSSVDAKRRGWLLLETDFGKNPPVLTWRPFDSLDKTTATLKLEPNARIEVLTDAAPFWAVINKNNVDQLAKIEVQGSKINLSMFGPIEGLKGSAHTFSLHGDEMSRLFIAANHQLRVYDVSGGSPRLILTQDFENPAGGSALFQIGALVTARLPAVGAGKADQSRLRQLLKMDYWDDRAQMAIASEIDKVKPSDTWAISLFTELLKNRQQSYRGGISYATRGLAIFGPAARAAVPDLIYATMEGAAIRGDALSAVSTALIKIDPDGSSVQKLLPSCTAKNYVCEHVGKEILKAIKESRH